MAHSLNNVIKIKIHYSLSAHLWGSLIPADVLSPMSLRKHPEGFRLPPRSPRSPYTMSSEPNGFGLGTCGFARRQMGAGSGPVVFMVRGCHFCSFALILSLSSPACGSQYHFAAQAPCLFGYAVSHQEIGAAKIFLDNICNYAHICILLLSKIYYFTSLPTSYIFWCL